MTISSLFPIELSSLLNEMEQSGCRLCLVGGATRDFFRENRLGHDLDFEVRGVNFSELESFFRKKKLELSVLPYNILRAKLHDLDLEFSIPRVEKQIIGNKSHHHFNAEFDINLDYKAAFKRRDFTLNAIGIELNMKEGNERIIDPYSGLEDLRKMILREISDDFFLDSVRFLRMIRFHVKYGFIMSESLLSHLSKFDLLELSPYHFKEEIRKSNASGFFLNTFNELVKLNQLPIPSSFKFLSSLHFSQDAKSIDDLLVAVYLQGENESLLMTQLFSLPESKLKNLQSFHQSYLNIKNLQVSDWKSLAKDSIEQVTSLDILKDLKNLEEKKQWSLYFKDQLFVSWNDWSQIVIDEELREKTPAPLRSLLRYFLAIKKVVSYE